MSISQTTPEETASGHRLCSKCNAELPLSATFCSSCGERLERKKQASLVKEEDINKRYRITTLVRRHPSTNLYFALDNYQTQPGGQPRMVAIRDIEITGLKKEARAEAIALAQREYDQLRRANIPHLLTSIDLCIFQGHIFLVSGMPLPTQETEATRGIQRLYTLQDFLQSGQGLPKEARALEWIRNLCQALERLHRQHIIPGDLDPYTVVLNKNSVTAEPKLMVFWILPALQQLLPQPASSAQKVSYFRAPEAISGKVETRSDVYSLGALLYLLLTGNPPDESTLRHRRRLRSPREINSRISQHVDECVMQALAIDPAERFASVRELMAALEDARFYQKLRKASTAPAPAQPTSGEASDAETVRIVPLSQKDLARWRAAREDRDKVARQNTQRMSTVEAPPVPTSLAPNVSASPANEEQAREDLRNLPTTPLPEKASSLPTLKPRPGSGERNTPPSTSAVSKPAWKDRITGILPTTIKPERGKAEEKPRKAEKAARARKRSSQHAHNEGDVSLLKQLQRLLLGHQQHAVEAAAIVETPMRVRPDQPYNLRLHIMGRDAPLTVPGAKKEVQSSGGLSALTHGENIQVEVRSVLQQGYTYILQHASVTVPAQGYAAEVTIPMQPQPGGANGRRDRLHVFFLDEHRNPLYEKPFVVEVFVSPLVQFGREGHQVLTIPI